MKYKYTTMIQEGLLTSCHCEGTAKILHVVRSMNKTYRGTSLICNALMCMLLH